MLRTRFFVTGRHASQVRLSRLLHISTRQLAAINNEPPSSKPAGVPHRPPVVESPSPVTPSTETISVEPELSKTANSPVSPPVTPSSSGSDKPPSLPPNPSSEEQSGRKPFRLFRRLTGLMILSSLLYGTGVWYSTKSDNFRDFFTEYAPFGEECVLLLEEREFRRRFPQVEDKHSEELSVHVPKKGATWQLIDPHSAPARKESGPHVSAVSLKSDETKKANLHPREKTEKEPAPIEPPKETPQSSKAPEPAPKKEAKPVLVQPAEDVKSQDPLLSNLSNAVQNLLNAIHSDEGHPISQSLVDNVASSLADLSKQLPTLRASHEKEMHDKLEEYTKKFGELEKLRNEEIRSEFAAQEEKWNVQFYEEQKRIIDAYANRLELDIQETKKAYEKKLENALTSQEVALLQRFSETVADRIEMEREGRLGQLGSISKTVDSLAEQSAQAEKIIEEADEAVKLHLAVGLLISALHEKHPEPIARYISVLSKVGDKDPLVKAAIHAVPTEAYEGVLTPAQLTSRFRLVAPEIRRASLLPENAGVAAHAGSWLLSKLLWRKNGNPEGDDVESVLARAETALSESRIIDAIREVNSLQGWAHTLASDWLAAARTRAEVEFAAELISEEAKLWGVEDLKK